MANLQFYLTRQGATQDERVIVLSGNDVFGRGLEATVSVISKYISRTHCHVYFDKTTMKWFIRDLGSLNGTYINNDLIGERQLAEFKLGDFIGFGIDYRSWVTNPEINQDKDYFMFKFYCSNSQIQEACAAGSDFSMLCEHINRMAINH